MDYISKEEQFLGNLEERGLVVLQIVDVKEDFWGEKVYHCERRDASNQRLLSKTVYYKYQLDYQYKILE